MSLSANSIFGFFIHANTRQRVAMVVIIINHLVGIAGLNMPDTKLMFESISWINLLLTFLLVIGSHPFSDFKSSAFWLFILGAFSVGMAFEIVGVKTGFPFGSYFYTDTLSWALLGVPVIIGVNWILLSYSAAVVVQKTSLSPVMRAAVSSILLVLIDLFLEQFAIRHQLWVWQSSSPPLSNYLGWFAVSFIVQLIFNATRTKAENPVASFYLIVLTVFLVLDNLLG